MIRIRILMMTLYIYLFLLAKGENSTALLASHFAGSWK